MRAVVQEMMTNLFIATYNHQDEEGRCYSDSFSELPERDPGMDPNSEYVEHFYIFLVLYGILNFTAIFVHQSILNVNSLTISVPKIRNWKKKTLTTNKPF